VGQESDDVVAVSEVSMSQSIKVDIYGQVYPISRRLDEAYIRKNCRVRG